MDIETDIEMILAGWDGCYGQVAERVSVEEWQRLQQQIGELIKLGWQEDEDWAKLQSYMDLVELFDPYPEMADYTRTVTVGVNLPHSGKPPVTDAPIDGLPNVPIQNQLQATLEKMAAVKKSPVGKGKTESDGEIAASTKLSEE